MATARIHSALRPATRIRVDAGFDAHVDPTRNNEARVRLRVYRGAVKVAEHVAGSTHAPDHDQWYNNLAAVAIDAPASAAEQTYTLRAVRLANNATVNVSSRRLVLTEVL